MKLAELIDELLEIQNGDLWKDAEVELATGPLLEAVWLSSKGVVVLD